VSEHYFRFLTRDTSRHRCALLEQLLARAEDWVSVADWRADAFRVIAPQAASMPAVAAAALCADHGAVDAAWVCAATPVHYVAEMSSVRLPVDGMLSLTVAGADSLATDFNRLWRGSGVRTTATRSGQLFCAFDRALQVRTCDPQQVLGLHIEEFLPTGADSSRLRQLIGETEMWLFEHEANGARKELGLPVVNGLWFWGGGVPLASLPNVQGRVAGDDLFFNAFAASAGEEFDSAVIAAAYAPGSEPWYDLETRWLRPAIDKLRAGRLSRLQLSAEDRCFTVTARGLRRFWRRKKPWWESFG
jgi:hypothetical protein